MKTSSFFLAGKSYLEIGMKVKENFDAVERKIIYQKNKKAYLFFLSTLSASVEVSTIAESLLNSRKTADDECQLYNGAVSRVYFYQDLLRLALSGVAILLLPDKEYAIAIEVRRYPTRGITEPSAEKSVRGSKDGFTESLNDDIGMLRRRVRSKDLKIDLFQVGTESKSDVTVIYLDKIADDKIVKDIEGKIKKIDVKSLVMSDRALEEKLFKQKFCPFPLVRYTERPDIAAINLYQGKILIMVDTSPTVIIFPTTLSDHTKSVEEYRQSPLVGSFTRLLRTFAILLSVFLIPLWFALVSETDVSNFFLIRPSKQVDMPIILQILIAELFVEFIRLAIVHTPSELTSSIGVVAAIILGSVSIELEIFLPEVLVYVSFGAIASFATPSYELSQANRLVKYILLLFSFFMGRAGFMLGTLVTFCYLASIKIFNKPYLYPFIPFDFKRASTLVYREGASKKDIV